MPAACSQSAEYDRSLGQVNNSMAVVRAQRDEPAEALPFLQRAEAMYDEHLAEEHAPPLSPEESEAPADALRQLRLEDSDSWWLQARPDAASCARPHSLSSCLKNSCQLQQRASVCC